MSANHRKPAEAGAELDHYLVGEAIPGFYTRRKIMLTKITLALALVLAAVYAVPASAAPTTCGHSTVQYDSSGTWTGPYCD
jgi:hypothetical protein